MRINPTAQSLALILESLRTTIAPELSSKNAKSLLDIIQATLLDLLKRQGPSVALLKQIVEDGETLGQQMYRLLEPAKTFREDPVTTTSQSFEELALDHEQLGDRLARLGHRLSSEKRDHPETPALLRRAAELEFAYYSGIEKVEVELPKKQELPSSSPPLSQEFLQGFLTEKHGHLSISNFERLTGGHGKQAYLCEVRYPDGRTEKLVVRKSDEAPIIMRGMFLVEQEYALLKCLSKATFPSPKPYDLMLEAPGPNGVDGSFFTMEFLDGVSPSDFLGRHEEDLSEALLLQLADLLAKLHSVPLEMFREYVEKYEGKNLFSETTAQRYRHLIDTWYEYSQHVEHLPSTYLVWLFDWLKHNIPDDSRAPVLTHGDFNVHNILTKGDTVSGVLDWECADFAAPEQDLAYIQPVVSKQMSWDKFVDHYRASGGKEINPSYFGFCQAYSVLRTTLAFNRATMNLQRRWAPDIRFVMVELGYEAAFMGIGLQYTAAELVEQNGNHSTGHLKTTTDHKLITNGPTKSSESHNNTKYLRREDTAATVSGGGELISYGDHANVRQTPAPGETWQESVVLVWWDSESAVGGFHRLGHEPNRKDGPMATLWSHLVSPSGYYKRQRYQPLREKDQRSDGSFGCGDDTCTSQFVEGEHIWDISDGDVSAHLSFTDIGPNMDGFPKSKTVTGGFASHHFDIPGHVRGWVKINGHEYPVDTGLGIRDHAWGPRDWNQILQGHRWVVGAAGDALGFIGIAFQGPDDAVFQFGWVVRDGVVTLAKEIDILAYMEADSQVNRGGEVKYTLTTGEELRFLHKPVGVPACVSHHHGLNCVDRICRFECSNGLQGFSCFETTCNVKRLSARPSKFIDGIADDGFHVI